MTQLIINTDGGSRGNPGPAACAAILKADQKELKSLSSYLGIATNNQAEYHGVLIALNHLKDEYDQYQSFNEVHFILDSELVVKQLQGIYKIKNSSILPLAVEVKSLISHLPFKITFSHVRREFNKEADALLNQTLDSHV